MRLDIRGTCSRGEEEFDVGAATLKVAFTFPDCHRRGGVERVVLESANFLSKRGHEVHLCARNWDNAVLHERIVKHRVRSVQRPSWLAMPLFAIGSRIALQKHQLESHVLASFGVQSPPGGVLWVQSVHKAWMEISQKTRSTSGRIKQRLNPFHSVALAFEQYMFGGDRYRQLIALSDQVKQDLIRLYNADRDRIKVLPNGVNREEFNDERARQLRDITRDRFGLGRQDKVIAFVANELDRKGFGTLLSAISMMDNRHAILMVAGRAPISSYGGTIAKLGLSDRVKYVGSQNDVMQVFAASDVFALPTIYEAWGLVIIEALSSGIPVITSRCAGASIAVREGETGYLLDDPRDSVALAGYLDQSLASTKLDAATISASVATYWWDTILTRYEAILQSTYSL